jgi:hypothetical protein
VPRPSSARRKLRQPWYCHFSSNDKIGFQSPIFVKIVPKTSKSYQNRKFFFKNRNRLAEAAGVVHRVGVRA